MNRLPARCQVPECGSAARAEGLCGVHYARARRCCVDQCKNSKWLYGRCRKCFLAITDPVVFAKLKHVSSAEDRLALFNRLIQPPPPTRWQWAGDEESLAREFGKNDEVEDAPPVSISQENDDATGTK